MNLRTDREPETLYYVIPEGESYCLEKDTVIAVHCNMSYFYKIEVITPSEYVSGTKAVFASLEVLLQCEPSSKEYKCRNYQKKELHEYPLGSRCIKTPISITWLRYFNISITNEDVFRSLVMEAFTEIGTVVCEYWFTSIGAPPKSAMSAK